VLIHVCDGDFNKSEELLDIISLHNTTASEDIFREVCRLLGEYDVSLLKVVCVATDGAPSTTGKSSSFVAKLLAKQNEVSPDHKFHHVHCIIYQEVLCSKTIKMAFIHGD
jgi:hypothetical protein